MHIYLSSIIKKYLCLFNGYSQLYSLSNAYIFFFRIVLFVLNFFEYYSLSTKVLKHYRTYISKYEMDTIIVLQSMKKLLVYSSRSGDNRRHTQHDTFLTFLLRSVNVLFFILEVLERNETAVINWK